MKKCNILLLYMYIYVDILQLSHNKIFFLSGTRLLIILICRTPTEITFRPLIQGIILLRSQ
jgi:hypothetical protein